MLINMASAVRKYSMGALICLGTLSGASGVMAHAKDTLSVGELFRVGESLTSANGRFSATLQSDGNLVLTRDGRDVIWGAGDAREQSTAYYMAVQPDNNMVITGPKGVCWDTGTWNRSDLPAARLAMQDDGNLCLYAGQTCIWDTGTWTGFEKVRAEKAEKRAKLQQYGLEAIGIVAKAFGVGSSTEENKK